MKAGLEFKLMTTTRWVDEKGKKNPENKSL
jgi:hypothetical protein